MTSPLGIPLEAVTFAVSVIGSPVPATLLELMSVVVVGWLGRTTVSDAFAVKIAGFFSESLIWYWNSNVPGVRGPEDMRAPVVLSA